QLTLPGTAQKPEWDAAAILITMWNHWNDVFRKTLGHAERALVSELREFRNRWAHQRPFSTDDAYRALDSAARLLTAVSAPQADEIERMKWELLRVRFDEQARAEKRRAAGTLIENQSLAGLKPWREVVHPHRDVASGAYQQAEFAADLWQVFIGEGGDEYRNPIEFFRRTYLTESLKDLLSGAIRRLSGKGGDPVVQLQTNFGGGKTHSMLALYHLFSGTSHSELLGVDAIMEREGVNQLPRVNRVVLVGNKISPGSPARKPDGTLVRTLWGEIAWQLGFARGGLKEAKKAFQKVAEDDQKATSPGDTLRLLFNEYAPCLILIDEWVAYARQLPDHGDLPGGSFETHVTFAQALTESAKNADRALLVVSLPASVKPGSPHAEAEEIEVGGTRGQVALDALRQAVGRVESSWRPASAEESFEIVRRRLFEPMISPDQFVARDVTAKAFADLYRTQHQEFPPECREGDYEKRLKAAYPIHPEVFDRLYQDWSSLVKFQRTRGVLRLMASVIHSLWEKGDRSPLILPSSIPIDDPRVQFELTRYLSDNWVPVIEKDVDGPNSLPFLLDRHNANLGKYSACRRVARTIYMGSAPTTKAATKGIDDRRIKLGCVMPGESTAIFGDALRRLSAEGTYLYQDAVRYWYSTQPTVTKLAEDRAEQLKNDPDAVAAEIGRWLRNDLQNKGDFGRVHPLPRSSADVPDDKDARLVVFGIEYAHTKDTTSPAIAAAKEFLLNRGTAPRIYRNTLVFLAADKTRLQDLDEDVRQYLAWMSIVDEAETLNLDPHQTKQAVSRKESAQSAVAARLPETYQWLIVPTQANPQANIEWQAFRLTGQDALAVRASKKLRNDELLVSALAASRLRLELDQVPLWRGDHVSIRQLTEDFARYLYLPRLKDTSVLVEAIRSGLGLLTWSQDSFAYAESFDATEGRYRGLQAGRQIQIDADHPIGLLVKPEVALKQMGAESKAPTVDSGELPSVEAGAIGTGPLPSASYQSPTAPRPAQPKRFHGTVMLDADRAGRDASRIAEEVIAHLSGIIGAKVKVTLEIDAEIPGGAPEHVVRTVTENCRTLKFSSHGFEPE
ncbi:MAG: Swt1 family HEPN domain-containing protein, partial [candidate division KSB1 bacterium]|nr:Swt1 family HEPN domain-containing protein [candidate division KSB1 bacterium]